MISLSLNLAVSVYPRDGGPLSISGFAYPNETLAAPAGASYQWYVNDIARGTAQTLVLTVNDIGLVVRCVVNGVECAPVTVWHPDQISAVKHFWWAAQGAYSVIGNDYTDETAPFTITQPESITINRAALSGVVVSFNGKAIYGFNSTPIIDTDYCYWDSTNSRWYMNVVTAPYGEAVNNTYFSTHDTTYPWQATTWTNSQTATRVATTTTTLATDGQAVIAWRDIIGGKDATTSSPNAGLFESTDLDTTSIKFDSTDFLNLAPEHRSVFNSQNCCYIFAGAQDTAPTGGDTTHGVVSINRTSTIPKLGLSTRASSSVFRASASSNNSTAVNASSTSNANYNVLTAEALFTSGSLRLRVNGSVTGTTAISTTIPNNTVTASFIGAATSNTTTNFNGYMTAIILASGNSPISDTDRSRIERFIGLLDGLNVAYEGIGATRVGSDNPANAAEPNATAWVLMDGPWYNTQGDPGSGFIGGQSWRKMAPIDYAPYGNKTYVYGDETVRYETGVWLYINATLGEIARAYGTEPYPWLATWNNGFSAAKITSSYNKTTNYPAVP